MNRHTAFACLGLTLVAGSLAFTQPAQDGKRSTTPAAAKPAGQPDHAAKPMDPSMLPPGWTEADMKACMEAGMPGPMHEELAKKVGTWDAKVKMWMAPGTPEMESTGKTTYTSVMDGRFVKCEIDGEMPGGMGPFNGVGMYGYDNVLQKFQSTFITNCGSGMMTGTGELSSDGQTLTWNFKGSCPVAKKEINVREVERWTGKDTFTVESFGPDPKSGKEYKMMEISYTRSGEAPAATKAPARVNSATPGARTAPGTR